MSEMKPDCSYWVEIAGSQEDLSSIESELKNYPVMEFLSAESGSANGAGIVRLEVAWGVMEQTDEIEKMCADIAAKHVNVKIKYEEVDETPHAPGVTIFFDGGKEKIRNSGADLQAREIDSWTKKACLEAVRSAKSLLEAEEAILRL